MADKRKRTTKNKSGGRRDAVVACALAVIALGLWGWAYFSGALDGAAARENDLAGGGLDLAGDAQTSQQASVDSPTPEPEAEPEAQPEPEPEAAPEPEPTTQPETDPAPTFDPSATSLANGVQMYERDGVTYLDIAGREMLLVNKSYHLPSTFGNGITSEAQAAFDRMAAAAAADGYTIWIGSGFRSYDTQEAIFNRYAASSGEAAANRYSARPGQSEHQTGLAMDIAGGDGSAFLKTAFEDTPEFAWLDKHAADYGFILRFLKDREWATGYIYEPWHYRYVGEDLARILKDSGLSVEEYAGLA